MPTPEASAISDHWRWLLRNLAAIEHLVSAAAETGAPLTPAEKSNFYHLLNKLHLAYRRTAEGVSMDARASLAADLLNLMARIPDAQRQRVEGEEPAEPLPAETFDRLVGLIKELWQWAGIVGAAKGGAQAARP